MTNQNTALIRKLFEKIVEDGGEITSKQYILVVMKEMIEDSTKEFPFMKYIKVSEFVELDPALDEVDPKLLVIPINKIYNFLFMSTAKSMIKAQIPEQDFQAMKALGLTLE